jgi:hypothetical protein
MTSANPVTLPLSGYSAQHACLSVAGAVATITLNRPERKNPLTSESCAEVANIFRAAARDKGIKAIVMTGAGGNCCSSGDVFEIIRPLTQMDTSGLLDFTRMTGKLVTAMRAAPQPMGFFQPGKRARRGANPGRGTRGRTDFPQCDDQANVGNGMGHVGGERNRGGGCGLGFVHGDRGFCPRLPGVRGQVLAGVRGQLNLPVVFRSAA